MSDEHKSGTGTLEIAAVVIVLLFTVTVLFVFMSAIAGAIWWTIKMAVLVVVLILAIGWAYRRSTR